MKGKITRFFVLLSLLLLIHILPAQNVVVSGAHASSNGTYANLNAAFSAINGQSQTGNSIRISIDANVLLTSSAVLNAGTWSSLIIFPSTTGLTISGNFAAPLIDLNGADNVTIDGRVGGVSTGASYALTISNSSSSNTAGTSTIRFIAGAVGNTVQHTRIEGSSTLATTGTLFFSTGGNNTNTIANNLITHAGVNRPFNSVYASGTPGNANTGNIIEDNEVFDSWNTASTTPNSHGILLEANNTGWIIRRNSFFETGTLSPTTLTLYTSISIGDTGITGTIIRANFIGGTQAQAGGTPLTKSASISNAFAGIRINAGSAAVTMVDSNIIRNITWGNTNGTTWHGIQVLAGVVDIGVQAGNQIGSSATPVIVTQSSGGAVNLYGIGVAGTGSIRIVNNRLTHISLTLARTGNFWGIHSTNTGSLVIDDNRISDITTSVITGQNRAGNICGIYKSGTSTTVAIRNNIIGSTTSPNSLHASQANTGHEFQTVYGIQNMGAGTITITGNTIANLTNAGTSNGLINGITSSNGVNLIENNIIRDLSNANSNTSSNEGASVGGIVLTGNTLKTVRGNTVFNLQNTRTDFAGHIYGIYFTGATGANNGVFRNLIHSLDVPNNTGSTAANIYGIRQISNGIATFANNIVVLQGSSTAVLHGLFDNGTSGTTNFYHNTVYIGGTATTGAAASYCLWSDASTANEDYRNNILVNQRSGGTGTHYAIRLASTGLLTIDHNLYQVSGGGLGQIGSANFATLATWQAATAQDILSLNTNPQFVNAGGTQSGDYIPAATNLIGTIYLQITDDFTGTTRQFLNMGAFDVTTNSAPNYVTVVASSGTATAHYIDLTQAFIHINNGTHQGNIDVIINASHPIAQVATLNASTGSANYSHIHVFPATQGVVVGGSLNSPVIDLNGATQVRINGQLNGQQNGTSYALTLRNANNGTTASTIRFINGASNNVLQHARIEGSSNSATSGTIVFATASASSGNNNNLVASNQITHAGSIRPFNSIYALGTTARPNTTNAISNNEVFNFWNPSNASESNGVVLQQGNTQWSILANHFYETTSFSPSVACAYYAVSINSSIMNGAIIRGNYIGGAQAQAGGTALTKTGTSNNLFSGIRVLVGSTTQTLIDSNVITNISWTNASNASWVGIDIIEGNISVGSQTGNLIGAMTGSNAIYVEDASTTDIPDIFGIRIGSTQAVTIANNTIASITTNRANSLHGTRFYGISTFGEGTRVIENNTIGSTTQSNSILSASASTTNGSTANQQLVGIQENGTGDVSIRGNTISNLHNAATNATVSRPCFVQGVFSSGSGNLVVEDNLIQNLSIAAANTSATQNAAVGGIVLTGSRNIVSRNTIRNLQNTRTDFAGHIYGIYYTGGSGTGNGVFRNFIHSLLAPGNTSTVAANIYGIRHVSGTNVTIANNIVVLQGSQTAALFGFYDNGTSGTINLLHNTFYVGGTATSGSAASFAVWSNAATSTQRYVNNILINARSGGSGLHYGIYLSANTRFLIDNNNYFTGTTGVLGRMGTTDYTTLSSWQAITGQDFLSTVANPLMPQLGSIVSADYIPAANHLFGNPYLGVTDDYSGTTRQHFSVGAYDVSVVQPAIITVNATAGTASANYIDLTNAFSKINDGTHQGQIEVVINSSYSYAQTATINASGSGAASYSSVRVYPQSNNTVVISNQISTPVIDLNGATQVTFDGRVGGLAAGAPYALTLMNINTTSSGSSLFRFINGASNNTLAFMRINSSAPNASGTIFFSTASATTGNDNNTITQNLISGRTVSAIFSNGTNGRPNTGNIISNNEFFDFWRSATSQAINLTNHNLNWQITANSFYETTDLTVSPSFSGQLISVILLNSGSVNGTIIRGNYLGGSQALAGGQPLRINVLGSHPFNTIRILAGTSSATHIDSNIISNIYWTNNSIQEWAAINISSGNVQVGTQIGNIIGSQTGSNSIFIETSHSSSISIPEYMAIKVAGGNVTLANNTIASITNNRTGNVTGTQFYAISTAGTGTIVIENNTIGSTSQTNSIFSQSQSNSSNSSSDQDLIGIYNTGTGSITIRGNTIANLTNASANSITSRRGFVSGIYSASGVNQIENNVIHDLSIGNASTSSGLDAAVSGIMLGGSTVKTVRGNTIFNLRNTRSDFGGHIYGIYFTGTTGTNNGVYRNFIHTLEAPNNTSTVAATIYGVRLANSNATIANNIVVLQGAQTALLYGFFDNGTSSGTTNFFHNTLYMGGAASAGSASSFGIWSNAAVSIQNYRNNIIVNERTGGTGSHFAIAVSALNALLLDHNTYHTSNTGILARLGSTDYNTLSDWQTATSMEGMSNHSNPQLAQPGGLQVIHYIPAATNLFGSANLGIVDDYTTAVRQHFSAGAFDVTTNQPTVVTINATAGTSTANYSDLVSAFNAINSGIHQGQIEVVVLRGHAIDQTAQLNRSGIGSSNYSSVHLYPNTAGIIINTNISMPLLELNGANNVTINGRVGGQNTGAAYAIVFRNINNSNTVGNTTVRFINGALDNIIQFTRIEGSTMATASGIILFAGTNTSNGNSNNLIAHNLITNAVNNRPIRAVYSAGTAAGTANTANVFRNNDVFDVLPTSTSGQGVLLLQNNTNWRIEGNSFYETGVFTPSSGTDFNIISINHSSVTGTVIRGNFIGGTQSLAGGSSLTKSGAPYNTFTGIQINAGTAAVTQVDSNIIRNINWPNNSWFANWTGISVVAGRADIGVNAGNEIGGNGAPISVSGTVSAFDVIGISVAGTGNDVRVQNNSIRHIALTSNSNGSTLFGIRCSNTGSLDIDNNVIANLTTAATAGTLAANLYGILKTASSGTLNIRNNTIGSTTIANSLHATSTSTANAQWVYGIQNLGSGTVAISGNTIANLTNATTNTATTTAGLVQGIASTAGTNLIENNTIRDLSISNANTSATETASVGGIVLTGSTVKTIRNNTIFNLQNTFTNFAGHIYGIYFTGSTGSDNGVFRNFIHSLNVPNNSSTIAAHIYGVRQVSAGTYGNNIIVLQTNRTAIVYGIFENGNSGPSNFYHNTVYIAGTASAGSAASFAFWSNAASSVQDFRNNIFVNQRSGGSGSHYAIRLAGITSLTLDFNTYHVGGAGILGAITTTNYSTLAAWRTATAQDANSLSADPQFANPGGLATNNYIPSPTNLRGNPYTGILDDYSGSARMFYSQGAFDVFTNYSQVTVNASAGIPTRTYFDLTQALIRINDGTHRDLVEVVVHQSHILEQTAMLTSSGSGLANYTGVKVYPSTSSIIISGNLAAPLLDLNGATNTLVDGRVGGLSTGAAYALTLRNTNSSTTAGTSTIRFINGAISDTIQYVRIEGSSTSTSSGLVFFSTGGNNNNLISNNLITNALGNRPVISVSSLGSANNFNSGNIICDNEIFDFFSPSRTSNGILLEENNSDWRIERNSMYETGSLSPNNTFVYTVIFINNSGVTGTVIRGNFIGGSQALAGGNAFTKTNSSSNVFYGIRINAGTSTTTQIDSNVIRNINWTNSTGSNWFGIDVAAGLVDIGVQRPNYIGGSSATVAVSSTSTGVWNLYAINLAGSGSIRVANNRIEHIVMTTAETGSNLWAIRTASTGSVDIENNVIANLTASATSGSLAANLYGIHKTASAGTLNILNNTIGSSSNANSLLTNSTSTGAVQVLFGIQSLGTGTVTISGNTIANLTNATTNATASTSGLINGIALTNGTRIIENNIIYNLSIANANNSATHLASIGGIVFSNNSVATVRENTIYNLQNTFTNFTGHIHGIYFAGANGTENGVFRNFVHSITVPNNTSTTAANIYGIRQVPSGAATFANNIVVLQGSNTAVLHGLYDNGTTGTTNFYHNTVYIGGTANTGAAASFGLWSNSTSALQDYRNNILVNERSGGTGTHYAIRLAGITNLTINNNLYRVGTNGVVGWLNANMTTLIDWRVATSQDVLSLDIDPQFAQAGGLSPIHYIPAASNMIGSGTLAISDDFSGAIRIYRNMGAYDVITLNPVEVIASAGISNATYADLTTAFARINDGTHQGDITTIVHVNHLLFQTAVLNASGIGLASYTRVSVHPSATSLVITGNLAAPLVDLNGVENVTIDGRVGGLSTGAAYALTLRNTNSSTTAGTSTIRFINGASGNTLKNLRLEGSTNHAGSGILLFSTGGNNNNFIANNQITNAEGNRPVNSIYSLGTAANPNTANNIVDNEVFNILRQASSSQGLLLEANNANWRIERNSFYETVNLVPTAASTYSVIYVNNNTINGTVIRGNFIGGTQAQAGGAALTKTNNNSNAFYGIRINVGNATATQIDSNIIRNINWTNSTGNNWFGIDVVAGLVDIGLQRANLIGGNGATIAIDQTTASTVSNVYGINLAGAGNIRVRHNILSHITLNTPISSSNFWGIHTASTGNLDVDSNTISNITTSGANGTLAANIYGIQKTASTGTLNIRGNMIGSTTISNSLHASSTSTGAVQEVYGIRNWGTGVITISGNTVANLTNTTTHATVGTTGLVHGIVSTSGTNLIENNMIYNLSIANANNTAANLSSVAGIMLTGATVKTVRGNTIYNLANTRTDFTGHIYGIYFTGSTGTDNGVFRNFVHSLSVPNNTGTSAANIYGIRQVSSGIATFANNIVSLQGTETAILFGLFDNGTAGTSNFYHNTVYIGGNAGAGSAASYGLWSDAATAVQDYRNNILVNERTGGTGKHYGIRLSGTGTLTINNNNYFIGAGGFTGLLTSDRTTLADWQIATLQDLNSVSSDPQFAQKGGVQAIHYVPSANNLVGFSSLSISNDYSGTTRVYRNMGAFDVFTLSPVEVLASTGVSQAVYSDLTTAFARINDGTHQGAVQIIVHVSHGLGQSALLNASGSGSANYSDISIYPSSASLVVTGNLAAPLVDLNGTSNVLIDGRINGTTNGTPYSLTLRNLNTSTTAGNSTVRFINGANANTLRFVRIEGSSTYVSVGTGTVFFSTSSGSTGNNNNIIESNQITNAAGNRPMNSIYSVGEINKPNTGNLIRNNELFDFLRPANSSQAILLDNHNEDWVIQGNSFFETSPLEPIATNTYAGIYVISTSANGSNIRGNFIGGSLPKASGTALTKTNVQSNLFYAIRVITGVNKVTLVDSNIIGNINWTNSAGSNWFGIDAAAGAVDIGVNDGNQIGGVAVPLSISNTSTSAWNLYGINLAGSGNIRVANNKIENITMTSSVTGSNFWGINTASTGTLDVDNNLISNIITATSTGAMAANLYGIYKNASTGALNIRNNIIGSNTISNSLHATSTSTGTAQLMYGILTLGTGTVTISGNTIANLTNATTNSSTTSSNRGLIQGIVSLGGVNTIEENTVFNLRISNANSSSDNNASVAGIMLTGASIKTVRSNTVFNLQNTRTDFAGHIYGIYFTGATGTNNGVFRNFVHSLSVPNNNSATAANIYGIRLVSSGSANLENNIINISPDVSAMIYGIFEEGGSGTVSNIYHNTVTIGGTPTSGSANSFALWSNAASATQDFRNNIFINERTGGSGSHYAIRLVGNSSLTINHNIYKVATGNNIGLFTSNRGSLSNWRTATGQDQNSVDFDPLLTQFGGSQPNAYKPLSLNPLFRGAQLNSVSQDFNNQTRIYYSMGAIEYKLAVMWRGGNGAAPRAWNNSSNWFPASLPATDDIIWFEANNNGHNLILDQNRVASRVLFNGSNKQLELGDFDLKILEQVEEVSEQSYIKTNGSGKLVRDTIGVGNEFIFHIGNNTYNPVKIKNNTDVTDDFSVRVLDGVRNRGLTGNNVKLERVDVTWDIKKASGNANSGNGVDLVFYWPTSKEIGALAGGGFTTAALNYYNSISEEWEIATTGNSEYVTGTQTLLHTGYKGTFSPFAIGASDITPLPVIYASFDALAFQQNPRLSKLTWTTSSEINNSHFEVEWTSSNSNKWEKVGTVTSQGNSYAEQHYDFIHTSPSQFNMYRLKQVDWDGNFTYSPIRTVWFEYVEPIPYTRLYPNPTQDRFTLEVVGAPEGQYSLYDAMGRLIESGLCQSEKSFSGLAAGVYQLRVQIGEKVETKRVIVAK